MELLAPCSRPLPLPAFLPRHLCSGNGNASASRSWRKTCAFPHCLSLRPRFQLSGRGRGLLSRAAANDKSKSHSNATRRAAEVNAKNFCSTISQWSGLRESGRGRAYPLPNLCKKLLLWLLLQQPQAKAEQFFTPPAAIYKRVRVPKVERHIKQIHRQHTHTHHHTNTYMFISLFICP